MSSRFLAGLDLGQAADYSAIVIAERCPGTPAEAARTAWLANGGMQTIPAKPAGPARYDVRYIHRWKLGTPYPAIVQDVGQMLTHPSMGKDVRLIVDGTGVGRAVVDLFRGGRQHYHTEAVMITAGDEARYEGSWHYVPKRELVGTVQVLLQTGRLRFAEALEETALLTSELQNFQVRTTAAANEVFNAREGQHDDLVLALALALWYGENARSRVLITL